MRRLAPRLNRRPALEHFGDPEPRPWRRSLRQCGDLEEAASHDFVVGFGKPILAECPDNIDRDMIAAGHMAIEEQAVQHGLPCDLDAPLLQKLASERFGKTLANLD